MDDKDGDSEFIEAVKSGNNVDVLQELIHATVGIQNKKEVRITFFYTVLLKYNKKV